MSDRTSVQADGKLNNIHVKCFEAEKVSTSLESQFQNRNNNVTCTLLEIRQSNVRVYKRVS